MKRALVLLALAATACDGAPVIPMPDAGSPTPDAGPIEHDAGPLPRVDGGTDAGPPPAALVRFVHAAPGTETVSFRASGFLAAPDVYYRAATPYRRVSAGEGVLTAVTGAAVVAESERHAFEDGAHYVAVLIDPSDAEPTIAITEEAEPAGDDPIALRVLNATDGAIDVDVDPDARGAEITELAEAEWSEWVGLADASALRPVVGDEPFSITMPIQPWVAEATQALLVVTGRPSSALPSETEGLSILLVLDASEEASPFFVLRPDPRLAILQASPRLPTSAVWADPSSGGARVDLAPAIAYGEFIERTMPPGPSFVSFVPEGELWGPQVNVDLLAGHRYLLVTRGDPGSFGDDRFEGELVRDAIEGDRFVVIAAASDAPALRWFAETAPDTYTAIDALASLPYGQRTAARGIVLDPAQRLAVARDDRSEPNVWFEAPTVGPRGFVVLTGSYFADPSAPDALTTYWIDAPARAEWSASRAAALPGSGPLPDELPTPP